MPSAKWYAFRYTILYVSSMWVYGYVLYMILHTIIYDFSAKKNCAQGVVKNRGENAVWL